MGEGGVPDIEGDGTPDLFPPIFLNEFALLTYATTLSSTISGTHLANWGSLLLVAFILHSNLTMGGSVPPAPAPIFESF